MSGNYIEGVNHSSEVYFMNFSFYVTDIETTGLDSHLHDVIELSMYRLGDDSDNAQQTWCLKPLTPETIESWRLARQRA